jgi:signal peptidase I
MMPTLCDGDRVLALRYWPMRWLRKGQIVLVSWPWLPSDPSPPPFGCVPYIKRIVGLPGEVLVFPAGSLDRPIPDQGTPQHPHDRTWFIPAGHLFVRGDNRRNMADSRTWGPIPMHGIVGLVLMKLP